MSVTPPRVVFDLRYASAHYPGVGTYAAGLARALFAARPDADWRFLVPARDARFDLGFVPAAARVPAPPPAPPGEGFRLGARLRRLGAALYHSPYLLRPWNAPCPAVVTLHDVIPLERPADLSPPRRALWRFLAADALRAAHVVTDSRASAAAIARAFAPARAPEVLLPGTPEREAGPDWPAGERPAVVAVGINKPHKNLVTLVAALARLPRERRPLLVVAGPRDPRWPDAGALAAAAGIAADVRALGVVPEARLPGLYRSAAAFAFPTTSEGFGMPVLEAMREGTPVVCSDLPVLREAGGDAARYLPALEPAAWAAALAELLADPAARAALAAAGRARAAAFTWARAAAQALAGHDALLAARTGA